MKQIAHPRRLLIVGKPACDIAGFVTGLTGNAPVKDATGSVAGSIHEWSLATKYYSTTLPVWLDEIASTSEWKDEFSRPEAKEVIEAVGGWICLFSPTDSLDEVKGLIEAIDAVIREACGYDWDGVKIASVYVPGDTATVYENEELDDFATDHGFELVDANAKGKTTFGEQQGFARIVESLEANDWTESVAAAEDGDMLDEELDMNDEFWGMKASLLKGEEGLEDDADDQLRDFESLLVSAQAVKELGQDLPPEQRRRVQERAARDLLAQALKSTSLG